MKINFPMMLLSMTLAAVVNIMVYLVFGLTVALIEAIPGGLLIGFVIGLWSMFRKKYT